MSFFDVVKIIVGSSKLRNEKTTIRKKPTYHKKNLNRKRSRLIT